MTDHDDLRAAVERLVGAYDRRPHQTAQDVVDSLRALLAEYRDENPQYKGGLAERTTSTDSHRVRLAGLEVPEAQAQTTVPAPPPAESWCCEACRAEGWSCPASCGRSCCALLAEHPAPEPPVWCSEHMEPYCPRHAALDAQPSSGGEVTADELAEVMRRTDDQALVRTNFGQISATYDETAAAILARFDVRRKP